MPSITVKNIPPDIYEFLKKSAINNHRSINNEIIACIESQVRSRPVDPEQLLARARRLREKTAPYIITDDEFTAAKENGRL